MEKTYREAAKGLGSAFLQNQFSIAGDREEARRWLEGLDARALSGDEQAAAAIGGRAGSDKSRKDEQDEREGKLSFWDRMELALQESLRQMEDYLSDLADMAEALRERIRQIEQAILKIKERMDEILKTREGARAAFDYFDRHKHFERDENGRLANRDAQKLLDKWIANGGRPPANDLELHEVLRRQLENEEGQRKKLEQEKGNFETKLDSAKSDLTEVEKRALELIEQRNRILNDPDLSQQQKSERLHELWKDIGDAELLREIKQRNFSVANEIDEALENKDAQKAANKKQEAKASITDGFLSDSPTDITKTEQPPQSGSIPTQKFSPA